MRSWFSHFKSPICIRMARIPGFILLQGDDTGWHKLESQPKGSAKLFLYAILRCNKGTPDVSRLVPRAEETD